MRKYVATYRLLNVIVELEGIHANNMDEAAQIAMNTCLWDVLNGKTRKRSLRVELVDGRPNLVGIKREDTYTDVSLPDDQ